MHDRDGRDEDAPWRWAFRRAYGRGPKPEELRRYKHWHGVSRRLGFDASGPWEAWPTKPIPPDAVAHVPTPAAPAAPAPAPPQPLARTSSPAKSPPTANGRPRAKERAERCLRELLANGPRHGDVIKRDATKAAKISERTLIAAADRLGVRCRRGEWFLPG
jgi:hypothetical protein